jgi:hypothetical protein
MTTEREPNLSSSDDSPTTTWTPPPNGPAISPIPAPTDPPRRGGSSRLRLGVAFVVTVLILGVAATAIVLTAGSAAPPTLASYVAADDVAVYGEIRLDLPGDQRQNLGAFLARFPGLGDQPIDSRISEAIDELVEKASKGRQSWTTDIEPWFDGTVGIAITPDAMAAVTDPSRRQTGTRFGTVLLAVKDGAKAQAWLEKTTAERDVTAADYKGTALQYVGDSPRRLAMGVYAGQVLLMGDETTVHKAIDQGADGGFGSDERFKAARAAFSGDALGFMYVDLEQYVATLADSTRLEGLSTTSPCITLDQSLLDRVPDWMIMRVQARPNGLAFEAAYPHVEGGVATENRLSRITPLLPASTIAYFEVHDTGRAILDFIAECRKDPEIDAAIAELEPQLRILGGLEGILGWMQDVGVVVTRDGDQVDGGLVISTAGRAEAERVLGFVSSGIELAGGSMGFDVREEEYAGSTVTILDLGDWQDLAQLAGEAGSVPFEGRLEIGYAVTDDAVVLGLGDRFVKSALDASAGGSLADDERFKSLLGGVGAEGAGSAYLDIAGVRALLEELLGTFDPESLAEYEQEAKPWLEPLDAYIQSTRRDGQYDRSTGILTVK